MPTHKERLALADLIKQRVLNKHGDHVLAIAIYGSVAKHEDGEHSDLEMWAVLHDPFPSEEHISIVNGIFVDLSYLSQGRMLELARRVTGHWPLEIDAQRVYVPLFEQHDFFARLQQAANEVNDADFAKGIRSQTLWSYEVIGKLKNAYARGARHEVLNNGREITFNTAMIIGLANRQYYKSMRELYPTSKQMPLRPTAYNDLLDHAGNFTTTNVDDVYDATLALWEQLQIFVAELGIEWQVNDLDI